MTAGLLPGPVWLIVRPDYPNNEPLHALGPIRTLEKLRGVYEGIHWAGRSNTIVDVVTILPEKCTEVHVDAFSGFYFGPLEAVTFEQRLMAVLWYDFDTGRWDAEKEWNADRWQDVGQLLAQFGIKFPGENTIKPTWEDPG
jgi:hypothetical protein